MCAIAVLFSKKTGYVLLQRHPVRRLDMCHGPGTMKNMVLQNCALATQLSNSLGKPYILELRRPR